MVDLARVFVFIVDLARVVVLVGVLVLWLIWLALLFNG